MNGIDIFKEVYNGRMPKDNLFAKYKSHILPGPLNGTLVIGFCYYVAGPIALQNLVRQGALVIKLERKPLGDPSRQVFSPSIFNSMTHGQLSVALDYKQEADQRLLKTLLEIADIIVDNRSTDAQEHDEILQNYLQRTKKLTPKIYCTIDGFPNAKINRMTGLDASVQAITGLAYSNCNSPKEPLKVGIPILDITTGLLAAYHIVSNLLYIRTIVLPPDMENIVRIAVSLAGTSVWLQSHQFINALENKEYFRTGNQDKFAAPFSYYTAKNGLISIATVNETQFETFCLKVLKDQDFHNKYPTVKKRIEEQHEFEFDLNAHLIKKDKEYWLEQCKIYRVPASPVLTVSEAAKQGFVKELITKSFDDKQVIISGASSSLFSPINSVSPAPKLNQDHKQVVEALGLSDITSSSARILSKL